MPRRVQASDSEEEESQRRSAITKSRRVTSGSQGLRNITQTDGIPDSEEEVDESPKGRKRARANTGGDSHQLNDEAEGSSHSRALIRDTDGYVTGSIVRIQLKNFVTYDFVEFRPGPYLNMVIGPNGTGKSSIACAICLGLNFPPSLLGRQDLNSFVKQTKQKGYIEIELKGPPGKPNIVIRRELVEGTRNTSFTINGKSVVGKDVNATIAKLNIQVENLCTFLPQDRVAEFARMTPQNLLKETQRAAGNQNLTTWHESLIKSGQELKNLEKRITSDKEKLATLIDRNATLEKEVKRFEERQELENKRNLLGVILPFVEYKTAMLEYRSKKEERARHHEKMKVLKKRHQPMLQLKDELDGRIKALETTRKRMKDSIRETVNTMRKRQTDDEKICARQESIMNKLIGLKRAEKERQRHIQELEKQISRLKEIAESPLETEDQANLDAELNNARTKHEKLKAELSALDYQKRQDRDAEATVQRQHERYQQELHRLDNQAHAKLRNLGNMDSDCARTVEWLRVNQQRFRLPILEPPCLSISVKDQRYIDAVDALMTHDTMKTFVAQCEEDYKLLMKLVADTPEALGRRARIIGWFRPQGQPSPQPIDPTELNAHGFDGYALDYIECPEELKWFLQVNGLHRTPIALNERSVNANESMQTIGERGGGNFIAGSVVYNLSRSKYGKRLVQSTTRDYGKARWLGKANVDTSERENLQTKVKESHNQLQVAKETLAKYRERESELRADEISIGRQLHVLQERKENVVKEQRKRAAIPVRISNLKVEHEKLLNAPSVENQQAECKKDIEKTINDQMTIMREVVKIAKRLEVEQQEIIMTGLEACQVESDSEYLDTKSEDVMAEINEALAAFNDANHKFLSAKEVSKEKLTESRDKLEAASKEVQELFQQLQDGVGLNEMSAEEVKGELEQVENELEMNLATNRHVIDQYHQRQAQIEQLTQDLAGEEAMAKRIGSTIETARDSWEPALKALVSSIGAKFSAAFDRIGCAGEIQIAPHEEDYAQWAIDILVKFRDNEKLQLLTGQRQSGGERSLTTILYLMSLMEQARSPFSLVDEINQGMDARAERLVHNQLVDVTCNSDVGQYFLITPKLLPCLDYHPRMKVLCVYNGEWLPEEADEGNLMVVLNKFLGEGRGRAEA
ncbi:P-loop containing nucleoside triphosphate hydrolase protein [Thelephora terrestris]|uniref:Structural maintenance of chromosomes protein 5 n=1 Tax=Thelephora terrestris TaxID=56493 RepID=A0A9P6H7C3_9AGAM|nr:P-loop containing nucleoside triphosphate hydrolase protein [Thelephora terrestris]